MSLISIDEYRAKYPSRKLVKSEDGIEFEIRKITPIDLWTETGLTKDNTGLFIKLVLEKGVVSLKLSADEKEGFLSIREIEIKHQNFLFDEIMKFSGLVGEDGKKKDFLSQDITP